MIKKFSVVFLLLICCLAQAKPFTVILDWFINPDHAPLFVAEQRGYFKQQGLKVVFVQPADPADGPKLVAAGKANLAITYQPDFLMQQAQGLPLVQVGTLVGQPLDCLLVLKNGPIKTIKDLQGKKIAYSSGGGVNDAILQTMLQYNDLSLKDVQLVNVQYDLVQALLTHRVDAFAGGMRNVEALQLGLMGHPARIFYPEKNGFPYYSELIFVANKNALKNSQNEKKVHEFLVALTQGVAYLKAHPKQTWALFAKAHPSLDNKLNRASWMASVQYFSNDPAKIDLQKSKKLVEWMRVNHLLNNAP